MITQTQLFRKSSAWQVFSYHFTSRSVSTASATRWPIEFTNFERFLACSYNLGSPRKSTRVLKSPEIAQDLYARYITLEIFISAWLLFQNTRCKQSGLLLRAIIQRIFRYVVSTTARQLDHYACRSTERERRLNESIEKRPRTVNVYQSSRGPLSND